MKKEVRDKIRRALATAISHMSGKEPREIYDLYVDAYNSFLEDNTEEILEAWSDLACYYRNDFKEIAEGTKSIMDAQNKLKELGEL